tara:strand:+ start:1249 stop:1494 length:246 start_codon:yes stop_codon:yes gene_type:complete
MMIDSTNKTAPRIKTLDDIKTVADVKAASFANARKVTTSDINHQPNDRKVEIVRNGWDAEVYSLEPISDGNQSMILIATFS